MKKMIQELGCSDQPEHSSQQQRRDRGGERHIFARLTFWRVIIGALALVLLGVAGVSSLTMVTNSDAMPDCGILFPCPTPTLAPTPTAIPTPKPTPTPRPTPSPVPSPTVQVTPSPTAVVPPSPTAIPQGLTPTPHAIPTRVPASVGGQSGKLPPDQGTGNSFLPLMAIGLCICLVLLLVLGIGRFFLRRALLPPMVTKLPPSGARPWSRIRIRNPESLAGNVVMAGNGNSFVPYMSSLSNTNAITSTEGTFSAMSIANNFTLASAALPTSFDNLLPSSQDSSPNGNDKSWKIQEDDPNSSPNGWSATSQSGSLNGGTRYWKIREEDVPNPARVATSSTEPLAYGMTHSLSWSENLGESGNGDHTQIETNPQLTSSQFERGLLTNAPYYTRMANDEQEHM